MNTAFRGLFSALCCALLLAPLSLPAGMLDTFEDEATRDRPRRDSSSHHEHHHDHDSTDSDLDELTADCVLVGIMGLIYGGASSYERVAGDPSDPTASTDFPPRLPGDPMLPFLRIDMAYEVVDSDLEALDTRSEIGYGPVGFEARHTRYWEHDPADRLDLVRMHALYRMSFTQYLEVDLGIGALIIDGDERDAGTSFTMPILVRPTNAFGIEFRPAWATINDSDVYDYTLGALLTWQHSSLRAGYRWTESYGAKLNGPYVGVSFTL